MTEMLSAIDHSAQTNGKGCSPCASKANGRVWNEAYERVMDNRE